MSQIPDPTNIPPTGDVSPATPPLGYASVPYAGQPATGDEKTMGLLIYILAIFTGFLGPLIIWLIKKDTMPFVNDQGKEVLNWQLTIIPVYIICMIVSCLPYIHWLGTMVIVVVAIANLVFCILGAMTVNKGMAYRFPFSFKLLK